MLKTEPFRILSVPELPTCSSDDVIFHTGIVGLLHGPHAKGIFAQQLVAAQGPIADLALGKVFDSSPWAKVVTEKKERKLKREIEGKGPFILRHEFVFHCWFRAFPKILISGVNPLILPIKRLERKKHLKKKKKHHPACHSITSPVQASLQRVVLPLFGMSRSSQTAPLRKLRCSQETRVLQISWRHQNKNHVGLVNSCRLAQKENTTKTRFCSFFLLPKGWFY